MTSIKFKSNQEKCRCRRRLLINPLTAEFIYLPTSAERALPINRPTAVKGFKRSGQLSVLQCIGWQPFPTQPACGVNYITGAGGDLSSPGYPNSHLPGVQCTWMIKVDNDKKIILNFETIDLGHGWLDLVKISM